MLTAYLNTQPYSRFVLIEDSFDQRGGQILKYLLRNHLKHPACKIHYFVFEGNFQVVSKALVHPHVQYYDFVSDPRGWLSASNKRDFVATISQISRNSSVFVIDSLSQAILLRGEIYIYKTLQSLLLSKDPLRIISILHQDVLENPHQTSQFFQHLSTLYLDLEPSRDSDGGRIAYTYRKTSGKVYKEIVEYEFENGILKCEAIKKVDAKMLVEESLNQVAPENLTTFKISLNDNEKESRAQLVLPYLPKEPESASDRSEGGQIFYQFDHVDDWDEEDPDDDLDI